jgi:choline monooxygenase
MTMLDPGTAEDLGRRLDAGQTFPPEWYADREIYSAEQRGVFRRAWQYVGHSGLVRKPGDYFTGHAGEIPIVVTRDAGGNLNAFLNICRHRANVVAEGEGNRSTLQCGYHAWTYGLDGTLHGAPHSKLDPSFDKCALSLIPVRVESVGPFIFVNPDLDAAPLHTVMGNLMDLLREREWDPAEYGTPRKVTYDVECNWKINMENTECYHCAVMHPLIADTLDTRPEVMKISEHNEHFWDFTTRPKGVHAEGVKGDLDTFWATYYTFPNFWLITRRNDYTMTTVTLPLGPSRCRLVVEYWFPADWDEQKITDKIAIAESVLDEDIEVVEQIQRNQAALVGGPGQLIGGLEALIQGFEKAVYNAVVGA